MAERERVGLSNRLCQHEAPDSDARNAFALSTRLPTHLYPLNALRFPPSATAKCTHATASSRTSANPSPQFVDPSRLIRGRHAASESEKITVGEPNHSIAQIPGTGAPSATPIHTVQYSVSRPSDIFKRKIAQFRLDWNENRLTVKIATICETYRSRKGTKWDGEARTRRECVFR